MVTLDMAEIGRVKMAATPEYAVSDVVDSLFISVVAFSSSWIIGAVW